MQTRRKPLLVANWKLNNLWEDCEKFVAELQGLLPRYWAAGSGNGIDLVLCPAFPYVGVLGSLLEGAQILLGAQDVSQHESGAWTGEVSAQMLADSGCDFCIVGHSERRNNFQETPDALRSKLALLHQEEIVPIFCVGESSGERRAGNAAAFIAGQLEEVAEEIARFDPEDLVLAYEPVWAIGTGNHASPEEAGEMLGEIRRWLAGATSARFATTVQLLYGGSVNPDNIAGFLQQPEIDGALIGGASVTAESFARLVSASQGA